MRKSRRTMRVAELDMLDKKDMLDEVLECINEDPLLSHSFSGGFEDAGHKEKLERVIFELAHTNFLISESFVWEEYANFEGVICAFSGNVKSTLKKMGYETE